MRWRRNSCRVKSMICASSGRTPREWLSRMAAIESKVSRSFAATWSLLVIEGSLAISSPPQVSSLFARAGPHRAGMPRPDRVPAEQRRANITAQPQHAIRLQGDRAAIGLAGLGIVERAVLPNAGLGRLEAGHETDPAERAIAARRIGIMEINPLRVRTARLDLEPDEPPA